MMEERLVNAQKAWNIAYSQLELQLDRGSFDTWLRDAVLLHTEAEGRVFVVGVRNAYIQDMLQQRLYRNVRRVLSDVYGREVSLRFEVRQAEAAALSPQDKAQDDMPLFRLLAQQPDAPVDATEDLPLHARVARPRLPDLPESQLRPENTFERFIVSSGSQMAYQAAMAVVDAPGRNYNPYLVYGGVGLGKTHLLMAIAHACNDRGLRTTYISAEAFMNDMVEALRRRTMAMFREKYRSVDVLVLDDIQFIAGKDGMQEEFFHTFNALHVVNKQIVLASDRHPREFQELEGRLRSRFEGGLVLDIPPLDSESRKAIVRMWLDERGAQLSDPVIDMLVKHAGTSIRALNGAFNHLLLQEEVSHGHLTRQQAETSLLRFDAPRQHGRPALQLDEILAGTAAYYRLKPQHLTGKGRTQHVSEARQVAMYLARQLTELSLVQIGEVFARKHTTIMHGCNRIAERMERDPQMLRQVSDIRRTLTDT